MLSDDIAKVFSVEKRALSIQEMQGLLGSNAGYLKHMEENGELIYFDAGPAKMYLPAKDMIGFYEALLNKKRKE